MRALRVLALGLCVLLVCSCPAAIELDQLVHARDALGPTIAVTSPANRSYYESTLTVTGTVTDDAARAGDSAGSVVSLYYEVTGSPHSGDVEIMDSAFTFSFSTLDLVGDQDVVLRATDWNGNVSRVTLTVLDDTSGPAISVTSPEDQSEYRRNVRVEGRVSNSAEAAGKSGEVASLSYEVMTTTLGGDVVFTVDGTFAFEFLTDGLGSDLAVRISAADLRGDVSERVLSLKNDKTGPYLAIASPQDLSYYASAVVVSGAVANSPAEMGAIDEVASVSYSVGGTGLAGDLTPDEQGLFSFEFQTSALSGTIAVRVMVEDWNGNATARTVTLLNAGNDIASFAVVPGNKQITLSWDSVPFADSYTVYNLRYGETAEDVASPHTWGGLTNGKLYSFQLSSQTQDGHGEDNYSARVDVIPLSQRTLAPWVREVGYGAITIEWNPIPAADEYEIRRAVHPGGPWMVRSITSARSFTDVVVDHDTRYYYSVMPIEQDTISSDVACATPGRFAIALVGGCETDYAIGIAIEGTYAYVSDGASGLRVIDISDPDAPVVVFTVDVPVAGSPVVLDGYLYVGGGDAGLIIMDVASPAMPAIVRTVDTPGNADHVAVAGGFAYVSDLHSGLQVIDIAPLGTAAIVKTVDIAGDLPKGVAATDGYVYLASWSAGLRVIDVSSPQTATIIRTVAISGFASDVVVSGDCAYVSARAGVDPGGLRIVDISVPASAAVVGSLDTAGGSEGVAVSGGFAYLADTLAGLKVIDVATTTAPSLVRTVDTAGNAVDVAVSHRYAYVADLRAGVQVVDVATPVDAVVARNVDTPGNARNLTVSGDCVFVADESAGLQIIDVSVPTAPALIGAIAPVAPGQTLTVAVAGDYAYVGDSYARLQIVDVSSPAAPAVVGGLEESGRGSCYGIAVSGEYAYLADYVGLRIIDISRPEAPVVVGTVETGERYLGVAIRGDYAYVAARYAGLVIIDISDPAAAAVSKTVDTPGFSMGVALVGDYALVVDEGAGIQVVDVSTPGAAAIVHTVPATGASGISVSGSYAYVADFNTGLRIVDISTPSSAGIVATVVTSGNPADVSVAGRYAYVADYSAGLQIVDLMPAE